MSARGVLGDGALQCIIWNMLLFILLVFFFHLVWGRSLDLFQSHFLPPLHLLSLYGAQSLESFITSS